MVKCKKCEREFETLDSLRRHNKQKHGVDAEKTYIEYVLEGVEPTCKCGCGEKPKYLGIDAGFRDFIRGHAARVNNNWGHNPEALKKSHETQKKMHDAGTLKVWNDGLTKEDLRVAENTRKTMSNPERGNNISKALTGIAKSDDHKLKLSETASIRWLNQDERDKQSVRLISRLIKNNHRNKKTKLESTFENLLIGLGLITDIDYKYQAQVGSAIFDFTILNKKILIEVDGDFHHCNPNTVHKIPKYPIQIKTVGNDFRKNILANDHSYNLLRFWEKDINERPEWIIERLKSELFL
jgi:very-short-patch-repair endonuclease